MRLGKNRNFALAVVCEKKSISESNPVGSRSILYYRN